MKRLLATAAIALTAMCGAVRADTTLVIAMQADPTGLDPEAVLNNTSGFVMATIYDSLVKFKPGTTEVAPGLAEKWDISEDGLTYIFHLKKGVKFHDGTPFDAKAYVKDMDRWLKKDDPNYIGNSGPVEGFLDDTFEELASYRAVDDNTIEMKLKQAYAPFLTNLAMVWNGITSPAATAKLGKDYRSNPVGTGAFIFKEWKRGDQIVLTANPNYWNGKPKVDRIVFKVMPDGQAALLALKRGDVHILADVSAQIIPAMKQDQNIVVMTQPGLAVSGVGMPPDVKPLDDKRVRQALNYAIDKEAINKSLFQGLAVTMISPLPEAQWGFDKSLKGYPYDPKKAKELLAAAGYPNGFEIELLTYNSARGYNSAGAELAVAIQGQLEKVGVKASVRKQEMGAYLSEIRSAQKKYQGMFMVGWTGDNGDPDNFLDELFNSKRIPVTNTARYKNDDVDKTLNEAQRVGDHAKRVALYSKAQKQILEDAPWIFLNSVLQLRGARKEVKGYQLNPTQMFFDMEKVSLSK